MFTWLPSHPGSPFLLLSLHSIFCSDVWVSHHRITSHSLFYIPIILSNAPFLSLKVQYISYPFSLKERERRGLHVSVYFVFHFLALVFGVGVCCLAVSSALYSSACALFLAVCWSESMLSVCQSPLICCFASCFAALYVLCYFSTHIHTYAYAFVPFSHSFLHIQTQSWMETWTSLE